MYVLALSDYKQPAVAAGYKPAPQLGRQIAVYFPSAACSVLSMSMQIVMGPTPPGTGVMAEHKGATFA